MNYDADIVASLRAGLPDLLAIYRFGSHGSVTERSDSDIDVAVLGPAPFDVSVLWDLGQRLATMLGRDVDLVDLKSASTVLKAQIVSTGERIFCADVLQSDSYEDYVFSAYARLNEERRDILRDVLDRGSVYGT